MKGEGWRDGWRDGRRKAGREGGGERTEVHAKRRWKEREGTRDQLT